MSKPSRWISYSHNPGKTVLSSCLKWHRVEEINTKIILMINSNIFVLGWAVLCSLHPKTCNKVNISQPFPPYKMRLHDFGFGVFHCCSCLWEIHCWGTFRTAVLGLGRGKLEGFLSPGTEMAPWGIQKGVRCESCRVWGPWGGGVRCESAGFGVRGTGCIPIREEVLARRSPQGWGGTELLTKSGAQMRECDPRELCLPGRALSQSSWVFSSVVCRICFKSCEFWFGLSKKPKHISPWGLCLNSKLFSISWISLQFIFIPFLINMFCHRIQGKKMTQAQFECKQGSDRF